jgi:DNA-3-methyladenine glycosylase
VTNSSRRSLPVDFYRRPTLDVARELVGKILRVAWGGRQRGGRVVEVEAYLGRDDPASHAARGLTPRSAVMFGPAGVAYVYFIYGMYHCLNVVTEPAGRAGAVLVRALEPLANGNSPLPPCDGPGKLCRTLGIDLAWNGLPLKPAPDVPRALWLEDAPPPARIETTTRVGIRRAAERPYRFVDPDSRVLSESVGRSAGASRSGRPSAGEGRGGRDCGSTREGKRSHR